MAIQCKVLCGPLAFDRIYHEGESVVLSSNDAEQLSKYGLVEIIGEVKPMFVPDVKKVEVSPAEAEVISVVDEVIPVVDEVIPVVDEVIPVVDEVIPVVDEVIPVVDEVISAEDDEETPATTRKRKR
jgi:hypothetical protein